MSDMMMIMVVMVVMMTRQIYNVTCRKLCSHTSGHVPVFTPRRSDRDPKIFRGPMENVSCEHIERVSHWSARGSDTLHLLISCDSVTWEDGLRGVYVVLACGKLTELSTVV